MKKLDSLGIFIQFILLVLLIIFLIISFIIPEMYDVVNYILAFELLSMAYNNYKTYNKKKISILYFVVGLLLLISNIITQING